MLTASINIRHYSTLWNNFLADAEQWLKTAQRTLETMSPEEQLAGMCAFVLSLLILTVITPKKEKDVNASKGRQFTAALALVMIFAFGAGWTMETGPGSMSWVFAR